MSTSIPRAISFPWSRPRRCAGEVRQAPRPRTPGARVWQAHHLGESVLWQPPGRFWALQGIEAGIVIGIAAVLLVTAIWWIQHRTT
jgi:hypothetical protein